MSGANTKRMPGLGDEFRAAREARHLTLSDVSEQIHIRSVYLQCIEDEEWSSIAAPVYVRGFLRTYSRFLGLDPESAVERFNAVMGDAGVREPASVRQIGTRRGPSPWLWIAVGVAVLLVAFVGYKAYDNRQTASDAPQTQAVATAAASVAPSAAPVASAASSVAAPVVLPSPTRVAKLTETLVVNVTQKSWVMVAVDGAQVAEGIYPAGTVKKFHGKSASLRVGNAGGVDVIVNGKDRGPLGNAGSVVDTTIRLAEE